MKSLSSLAVSSFLSSVEGKKDEKKDEKQKQRFRLFWSFTPTRRDK